MKHIRNTLIVTGLVLVMIITGSFAVLAADNHTTGTNFNAAKKAYGIENVIYVSDWDNDIMSALQLAGEEATASKPIIVYAGSGSYAIKRKDVYFNSGYVAGLYVPKNVVFVAEKDTVITDASGSASKPLMIVAGSVYGGKYDCKFKVNNAIIFRNNTTFSTAKTSTGKQLNGNVEYTEVVSPCVVGIHAIGCKNFIVEHNIIRDGTRRATTGIGMMYSSKASSISYNKISNIGAQQYGSAISVTHSDAVNIVGNVIKNASGHGISTDSEQKGKAHAYSRITNVKNNTINGAKHGIWLEKGCQITGVMSGNKISNCRQNGVAVAGNKAYTGSCKWSINAMSNNTISRIKRSNLSVSGKYGKVRMVAGNTFDTSKQTNCVTLDKKGKLYITGKGNVIKNANGNGIYVSNGSYLKVTGKSTKITNNKSFAISLYNKSKAEVSNANLNGNRNGSARIGRGSKLTMKKCSKGKVVNSSTI